MIRDFLGNHERPSRPGASLGGGFLSFSGKCAEERGGAGKYVFLGVPLPPYLRPAAGLGNTGLTPAVVSSDRRFPLLLDTCCILSGLYTVFSSVADPSTSGCRTRTVAFALIMRRISVVILDGRLAFPFHSGGIRV